MGFFVQRGFKRKGLVSHVAFDQKGDQHREGLRDSTVGTAGHDPSSGQLVPGGVAEEAK